MPIYLPVWTALFLRLYISTYAASLCLPSPKLFFKGCKSQTLSRASYEMAEPCNLPSHRLFLCHDESCNEQGGDPSASASFSGASSGSLCSSASNLSDDEASCPHGHPYEPSSASSSTLQLDDEDPVHELSSLLAQLPVRWVYLPPAQV